MSCSGLATTDQVAALLVETQTAREQLAVAAHPLGVASGVSVAELGGVGELA